MKLMLVGEVTHAQLDDEAEGSSAEIGLSNEERRGRYSRWPTDHCAK
jgi:hypothetical protein